MTEEEIIIGIRRAIREPKAKTVSDTQMLAIILRGVMLLGTKIKTVAPSFFNKRISLSSNTHVFAWPSDCATILNVWDMETNAGDITGATNATPIVITETAHGRATDEITVVHSVGGNTAANGTWKITYINPNTYSLNDSVGTAAYTSGGKAYKELDATEEIKEVALKLTTQSSDTQWYPRERNIVIDDPDFTYDLIVDYLGMPDAISDIPAEYHEGLIAFGVLQLMQLPGEEHPKHASMISIYQANRAIWAGIFAQIESGLTPSLAPYNVADEMNYRI